jgi:hypothetical protein
VCVDDGDKADGSAGALVLLLVLVLLLDVLGVLRCTEPTGVTPVVRFKLITRSEQN